MSMIVDRMLKAGLITRKRDRKDRRLVYATITGKGKAALEPAAGAIEESLFKILAPLSSEERRMLLGLLEVVKHETIRHLNLGSAIEELGGRELERTVFSKAASNKYDLPSALHAGRRTGKRGRPSPENG